MKDTLVELSKGVQKGPAADLVPVLFGETQPAMSKKDVTLSPFNKNLDHSQVTFHCVYEIHLTVIVWFLCSKMIVHSNIQFGYLGSVVLINLYLCIWYSYCIDILEWRMPKCCFLDALSFLDWCVSLFLSFLVFDGDCLRNDYGFVPFFHFIEICSFLLVHCLCLSWLGCSHASCAFMPSII